MNCITISVTEMGGQQGQMQTTVTTGQLAWYLSGAALVAIILIIAGVIGGMRIRVRSIIESKLSLNCSSYSLQRHRKYTPSEREMRKRPKGKGIHRVFPEKLCVEDVSSMPLNERSALLDYGNQLIAACSSKGLARFSFRSDSCGEITISLLTTPFF